MSRLLRTIVSTALEERTDGVAEKEIEYVFYGRIVDFEELKNAQRSEEHEQWEIKIPRTDNNAVGGRMRVRKVVKHDPANPEYQLTTKTETRDGHSIEVTVPTTVDNFRQFQALSERGMIKTRYVFEIEGSDNIWEVDVFKKPGGGFWEWCKIDLEVDAMTKQVPPFPIELANIIAAQEGNRTEEEENKIRSLYDYEFITKNVFVKD